ncbi:MAG: hypothetical protein K5886_13170 [Lachnospiraceae bacterium]|nr:hypothetical protein [Lachnospiraceae bacterium]
MYQLTVSKGVNYEYGAKISEAGINFCFASSCSRTLFLCIYDKNDRLAEKIDLLPYRAFGNVFSVLVSGMDPEDLSYTYEEDGKISPDLYAKNAKRLRKWGESRQNGGINPNKVCIPDFDWKGDEPLKTDLVDITAYDLHVRGFTKHPSSGVRHKGTYLGLKEKTDYLNDLGINQIILMPSYDFDEIDERTDRAFLREGEEDIRINYWGFKKACYFMPKPEYSYSDDFVNEFKDMVLSMHRAGIEVIMRFYFPGCVNRNMIIPCLKYWVTDYHIDGFLLMGEDIPVELIITEPLLFQTKIYYDGFEAGRINNKKGIYNKNLADAGRDFMTVTRRFLKSDEDMLPVFTELNRKNPADIRQLNFVTTYEGFSLNDLVSYDYKHNEDNNENNIDGTDYNYSWNCGQEGMSRKKAVKQLRLKQMKNAMMMLMFSRGIPVILGGDEFMNTRNGNNNPYCQDNAISYLKWKNNKETGEFREFVKKLIRLRKDHPILHMCHEPGLLDTLSCGYPDLSYHAEAAWYPKFYNYVRNIGMMYCGLYAKRSDGSDDDFFYIAYNMHWEEHEYALPRLPDGLKWKAVLTSEEDVSVYEEKLRENSESITAGPRSVLLLMSIKDTAKKPGKKKETGKNLEETT